MILFQYIAALGERFSIFFFKIALAVTATPTASPDTRAEFGQSSMDFSWLFVKMIFAMLIVIALAIVLIRFILPKLAFSRSRGQKTDLLVLDRIPLDAKKALYVMEVEGRRFLVGASDNYIGLLTELKGNDENEKDR